MNRRQLLRFGALAVVAPRATLAEAALANCFACDGTFLPLRVFSHDVEAPFVLYGVCMACHPKNCAVALRIPLLGPPVLTAGFALAT